MAPQINERKLLRNYYVTRHGAPATRWDILERQGWERVNLVDSEGWNCAGGVPKNGYIGTCSGGGRHAEELAAVSTGVLR